jgi:hypothetical protein
MAKKSPSSNKPTSDSSKQLIDAIATVRQLQDFVKEHGTLDAALASVVRVRGMVKLTGGFDQLTQALEIVGKEDAPPQA